MVKYRHHREGSITLQQMKFVFTERAVAELCKCLTFMLYKADFHLYSLIIIK